MAREPTPLVRYLKVEQPWETRTLFSLKQAASEIDRDIKRIAGRGNVGDVMRRAQLMEAKRQTLTTISSLWTTIGASVESSRSLAAAEAIKSMVPFNSILRNVPGMTPRLLETYQKQHIQAAQNNIGSAIQRIKGNSYVPLSQQVYKTQALVSGQVDRLVNTSLAKGFSARELAAAVKGFIDPSTPGGASYAAMRLGRTEINNAFHATQVLEGIQSPFILAIQWNTSGSHPEDDECDEYAEDINFDGGEPGQWLPEDVPEKPHPNCLCYMTNVTMPPESFADDLIARMEAELGVTPDPIDTLTAVNELSNSWKDGRGFKREKFLEAGFSNGGLEIGRTSDGRHVIRKSVMRDDEADTEYLAGRLANVLGINDIHTIKTGPNEIVSDYVDGKTGADWRSTRVNGAPIDQFDQGSVMKATSEANERMMTMKNGKETGLLDFLIGNVDRHGGNWIVKDDRIVPIDHGLSYFTRRMRGPNFEQMDSYGPFSKYWMNPVKTDGSEGRMEFKPKFTREELQKHKDNIKAIRSEFKDHDDWYGHVIARLNQAMDAI